MKLTHEQGAASEQAALDYLLAAGCTLLARNWHCPFGEIDLIMQSGDTVLFVEVRYRRGSSFGGAAYSITPAKLAKLQKSAEHYLQQKRLTGRPCRIDAVLLEGSAAPVWLHNITG
mgnify:FL=1